MDVTPAERDELVRRVRRLVAGGRVRPAAVGAAVDRVLAAIPTGPVAVPAAARIVILHRASTPDLASRWRQQLPEGTLADVATATEGRHTVVVGRVDASQVETATAAASAIGASWSVQEVA